MSGIHSLAVKPKGASFAMVDAQRFVWSVLATDCNFAPNGGLYMSDWVFGWNGTGKGRIYGISDPALGQSPGVREVAKLLGDGFDQRPLAELLKLLGHADLRIRQGAQFALAEKHDEKTLLALARVAHEAKNRLARLHAIWTLGQISRCHEFVLPSSTGPTLAALLGDSDPEIRAQAARTLGDSQIDGIANVIPLLSDREPRVRLQAALALGRKRHSLASANRKRALAATYELLRENHDVDAVLRHGAVMALVGLATPAELADHKDASAAVRMGVLLALRRYHSPSLKSFLSDADPALVMEAARAIHDERIAEALPELAALLGSRQNLEESLLYRALNAHFILGKANDALAVAEFAARPDAQAKLRVEAVRMLGAWAKPGRRDRITGLTIDLGTRAESIAREALQQQFERILAGPESLRTEAVRVAAGLGLKESGPALDALVANPHAETATRVEALESLAVLDAAQLPQAIAVALKDADPRLRSAARRALTRRHPEQALTELRNALEKGEIIEKQIAFQLLGDLPGKAGEAILAAWLDRLAEGKVPGEIQLDLLEAAQKHAATEIRDKITHWESSSHFREALVGGNAAIGREIFFNKTEVYCLRCHKVQGKGGEVGPDLTGVGSRQPREYLLESIIEPSRQIAKGFETAVLALEDGTIVSGIVKEENGHELRLVTPEAQLIVVPKDKIAARQTGKSAMPEDLVKKLSKRELRDLVEFLAGLK
jgi:quinoprotein glucose dehydrogenase